MSETEAVPFKKRRKDKCKKVTPSTTTQNTTPKLKQYCFAPLTPQLHLGPNKENIVGELRNTRTMVEKWLLKSADQDFMVNGKFPIASLISLPRMGKSILLNEVLSDKDDPLIQNCGFDTVHVVRITFNQGSTLDPAKFRHCQDGKDVAQAAADQYFLRVLHAIEAANVDFGSFKPTRSVDWDGVKQALNVKANDRVVIVADEFTNLLDLAVKAFKQRDEREGVLELIGSHVSLPSNNARSRQLFSGFTKANIDMMATASGRQVTKFYVTSGWGDQTLNFFAKRIFDKLENLKNDRGLAYPCASVLPSHLIVSAGWSTGMLGALVEYVESDRFEPNPEKGLALQDAVPVLTNSYSKRTDHADLIYQYFEVVLQEKLPALKPSRENDALAAKLLASSLAYPADDGLVLSPYALQCLVPAEERWTSASSEPTVRARVMLLRTILSKILDVANSWLPLLHDNGKIMNATSSANRDRGERFEKLVAHVIELRGLYGYHWRGMPVNPLGNSPLGELQLQYPVVAVKDTAAFIPAVTDCQMAMNKMAEHVVVRPSDPSLIAVDLLSTSGFIQAKWTNITQASQVSHFGTLAGTVATLQQIQKDWSLTREIVSSNPTFCLVARKAAPGLEEELKDIVPKSASLSIQVVAGKTLEAFLTRTIRDMVREHA